MSDNFECFCFLFSYFCSCILILFSAKGPNGGHVLVVGPVMWDFSSLTCGVPPKFQYKDFGFQFLQTMLAVWNCVRQLWMFLFPILLFLFMYFDFVLSFGAQRRPRSRRGSCHVRFFKSHLRSASKISIWGLRFSVSANYACSLELCPTTLNVFVSYSLISVHVFWFCSQLWGPT